MYIRSLPHSRRSRNRRRSGRWVRCAILDRKWVAPSARIGLYLLDDKRRETERAVDYDGDPIALAPSSSESDLIDAIHRYGDGRYRLVARNRRGHILARRDFIASVFAHRLDEAAHEPRTEVERLKAELVAAREAAESARAERDAARAEAETLKQAIAERDAEITGLESALDRQSQALGRARRLYAELGSEANDVTTKTTTRPRRMTARTPQSRARVGITGRPPRESVRPPTDHPMTAGRSCSGSDAQSSTRSSGSSKTWSGTSPRRIRVRASTHPTKTPDRPTTGAGHELGPPTFSPPDVDFSGLRIEAQSQTRSRRPRPPHRGLT